MYCLYELNQSFVECVCLNRLFDSTVKRVKHKGQPFCHPKAAGKLAAERVSKVTQKDGQSTYPLLFPLSCDADKLVVLVDITSVLLVQVVVARVSR